MSETKHVETELSTEEYRKFKELAEEQGLPLTAALREAAARWIEEQRQVDPDDPLFEILEALDADPRRETPRTNAATEDDLVDEWSGDSAEIEFPESPASEE